MTKPHSGKFINCLNCDKEFYIPINRFNKAKYCSRKCQGLHVREYIKRACDVCGKEFEHISSRCNTAKYCSRLCYHRSQKGKGAKQYTCATCGKEFMGSPCKHYKFCTPQCRGLFQRKPEEYTSFANLRKAWKTRGKIRSCEICGYNACKDILGIHHKDKNRKNNALENLMIVCPNCHSLIHHKHISH